MDKGSIMTTIKKAINFDAIAIRKARLENNLPQSKSQHIGLLFADLTDIANLRTLPFEPDSEYIDMFTGEQPNYMGEGEQVAYSNKATLVTAYNILINIADIEEPMPEIYESNDDVIRRRTSIEISITKKTLYYLILNKLVSINTIIPVYHQPKPYVQTFENTVFYNKFDMDLFKLIATEMKKQAINLDFENMISLLRLANTRQAFDVVIETFEDNPVFFTFNDNPKYILSVFDAQARKGNVAILAGVLKYKSRCENFNENPKMEEFLQIALSQAHRHPQLKIMVKNIANRLNIKDFMEEDNQSLSEVEPEHGAPIMS